MTFSKNSTKTVRKAVTLFALTSVVASVCYNRSQVFRFTGAQTVSANPAESWPDVPTIVKSPPPAPRYSFLESALLSVSKAQKGRIAGDPLLELTREASTTGTLIYAPRIVVPSLSAAQRYMILRGVNSLKEVGGQKTNVANYLFKAYQQIYDPQFSPDGRFILFKIGDLGMDVMSYQLYIWDMQQKTIKRIGPDIANPTYRWVWWSPQSDYVAYTAGGDRHGYVDRWTEPLKLYVYYVKSDKSRLLVGNPGVTNISWTSGGTLLVPRNYGQDNVVTSANNEAETPPVEGEVAKPVVRRNVFEYSISKKNSNLLIPDADVPRPSPDGKLIAFWGTPNRTPDKQFPVLRFSALFLFSRATNERTQISKLNEAPQFAEWLPDGKRLLLIYKKLQAVGTQSRGLYVDSYDVKTQSRKQVAFLDGNLLGDFPGNARTPFLQPQVSRNGKTLFCKSDVTVGREQNSYTIIHTLWKIDLGTGKATVVAKIRNKWGQMLGYDWQENAPTVSRTTGVNNSVSMANVP